MKKLFGGALNDLLARYDTSRIVFVRYDGNVALPSLPEQCTTERDGDGYRIVYEPAQVPTSVLLSALQAAGPIRELTAQAQSIDHLIAKMYREMDL